MKLSFRRYIDHTNRCVFISLYNEKTAANARRFLPDLNLASTIATHILLYLQQ